MTKQQEYCACSGPEFGSQHPLPVTLATGDQGHIYGLQNHLCSHLYIPTPTGTHSKLKTTPVNGVGGLHTLAD